MNHIAEVMNATEICNFILPREEEGFIVDVLKSYEIESTYFGWINFVNFDRYAIYLHGGETNIWHFTEDFWQYAYASVEDSILESDEEIIDLSEVVEQVMMDDYYALSEAIQADLINLFNHFQLFYAVIDDIDLNDSSEEVTWGKIDFFNQPLQEVW